MVTNDLFYYLRISYFLSIIMFFFMSLLFLFTPYGLWLNIFVIFYSSLPIFSEIVLKKLYIKQDKLLYFLYVVRLRHFDTEARYLYGTSESEALGIDFKKHYFLPKEQLRYLHKLELARYSKEINFYFSEINEIYKSEVFKELSLQDKKKIWFENYMKKIDILSNICDMELDIEISNCDLYDIYPSKHIYLDDTKENLHISHIKFLICLNLLKTNNLVKHLISEEFMLGYSQEITNLKNKREIESEQIKEKEVDLLSDLLSK